MKSFQGLGSATLIGSMPQTDRNKAIEPRAAGRAGNSRHGPSCPIYPAEQMMAQYIEGLPGLVTEEDRQFVRSDAPRIRPGMPAFYEQYLKIEDGSLDVDGSLFRMGKKPANLPPFSGYRHRRQSAHSCSERTDRRAIYASEWHERPGRPRSYLDERFLDIVPKLLGLKARWQIEIMKQFGVPVIIFSWTNPDLQDSALRLSLPCPANWSYGY